MSVRHLLKALDQVKVTCYWPKKIKLLAPLWTGSVLHARFGKGWVIKLYPSGLSGSSPSREISAANKSRNTAKALADVRNRFPQTTSYTHNKEVVATDILLLFRPLSPCSHQ